jgi:hypothetical protein
LRQEAVSDWKSSLESFKRTGKPVQAELEAVSFPGIPVMPAVFRDLSMLDPKQQLVMIFKLSAQLARAKAVVEYRRAAQVLLHCEDHPRLPEEFRRIIEQKRLRLEEVSGGAGAVEHAALVYKDLLGGIVIDADAARADMLK